MGILGRDVAVSLPCGILEFQEIWEIWEEMWLCRNTPSGIPEFRELWEFWEEMLYHWALWNSGIPGIMGILGRDVISLGPLEFRNSGNSGKRCYITGLSGILEFQKILKFWEKRKKNQNEV